jgi:CCR4-NOT transcriptional regulation complex NOT5 subunit
MPGQGPYLHRAPVDALGGPWSPSSSNHTNIRTDDKRRPPALNLTPKRSASSDSSSSENSLKPRTPRFAEATSIHSPIEGNRSPFADPEPAKVSEPGDVGLGYINNRESVTVPMALKSPLKSAMKVPGTPGRRFENPMSPTFREEDILEKREAHTDKEQARDVVSRARSASHSKSLNAT